MVFSCTWNENKKNDIEEVRRAYGSKGRNGGVSFAVFSSDLRIEGSNLVFDIAAPDRRSPTTPGRNPIAVNPVESWTRNPRDAQVFHLNNTFEAHQKLATLSSNKPRAKGKIRLIGWKIPEIGANGGSQGKKRRMNVDAVTAAKRMKRRPLKHFMRILQA